MFYIINYHKLTEKGPENLMKCQYKRIQNTGQSTRKSEMINQRNTENKMA